MKGSEYKKPVLINLNEDLGLGFCGTGSGNEGCQTGNAASVICLTGTGGTTTRPCISGADPSP
jgi:hypothetical protein